MFISTRIHVYILNTMVKSNDIILYQPDASHTEREKMAKGSLFSYR